ncbi:hypothetical protein M3Y97_01042400 [Aphelenchoides bicaudatus]|nr:hypothetical protein M3Y97_01042400 [Aphelenchoides bicaudatus]
MKLLFDLTKRNYKICALQNILIRVSGMELFLQLKWILFVTFILLTLFFYISNLFYSTIFKNKPEKIRTSVVCEKTYKDGQEILGRIECPLEGFDSESIIRNNNRSFPRRYWTYNRRNGICVGDDAENCVPGFRQQLKTRQYAVAHPPKTVHCVIQKSMSRVFETLAYFLDDPLEFFLSGKDIIEDVFDRYLYKEDVWTLSDEWQHVMIVRDPIERFLSGYTHFCLNGKRGSCSRYCNECGTDIACFIERQLRQTKRLARRRLVDENGNAVPLTSKMGHMIPQTCSCKVLTKTT